MTDALRKEWDSIIRQSHIYIYGAAKTASRLYDIIIQLGYQENMKGFLVTNAEDNVHELCGLPVSDVNYFNDKSVCVLVPHKGVYKKQICSLLESLSFENICPVGQLIEKTRQEKHEHIKLEHEEVGWEHYNLKSEEEKEKDGGMREVILAILKDGQPDFGGLEPYQSLETIGLKGKRPTAYRINEYGLNRILRKQDDVLDIGCNSGFLDISIAGMVHSVTGIEYDDSLVKVADLTADYLKVSNCEFLVGDFNDWYKDKGMGSKYNIIFSFAIHHWLNLPSNVYVAVIDQMLKEDGYVCFESHIYGEDAGFDECYEEFLRRGYRVACEKMINDDGMQNRQYVLFHK